MIDVQCANEKCNAHKERVLVKLGFSRFDYTTDWGGGMIKCPQCESPCPQGQRDTVLFCGAAGSMRE